VNMTMPDPLPRPLISGWRAFLTEKQWDAVDAGNETLLWLLIENLGGFIWRMNHDLADGRIEDPTDTISGDITTARMVIEHLVLRTSLHGVEFDYSLDNDLQLPRPQSESYWKWYNRQADMYWGGFGNSTARRSSNS